MYKCPRGCDNPKPCFVHVEELACNAYLDEHGDYTRKSTPVITGRQEVKCAYCHSLAEWIDQRQTELFPVEPTLCA